MTIEGIERPNLKNPYHKEQILNKIVASEPYRSIAKDYGISHARISQIKKDNQELINQKKAELISKLPSVIETVTKDVKTNHRLSDNFSDNLDSLTISEKLQLKAQLDKTNVNILKIASIFPSQALLNFNQYNQDNRSVNIEPSIMGLFSGGFKDSMEVVDMEEVSDSVDMCDNVDKP